MNLACQTLTLTTKKCQDIEDICQRAHETGFNYIDLAMFEKWHNIDPSKITVNYNYWEKRVNRVIEQYKLNVCALNVGLPWQLTDPTEQSFRLYNQQFKTMIKFAKAINCPVIVIQPGQQQKGINVFRCRDILLQHLGYLGKIATDQGIKLAMEPHEGSIIENPDEALRVIQELYPLVGCCYDPSHFAMQNIPNYQTRALLDYTYHVHVRNATRDALQAAMDDGVIDMKWVYDSLQECDYNDYISIEYFNEFDANLVETKKLINLFEDLGVKR